MNDFHDFEKIILKFLGSYFSQIKSKGVFDMLVYLYIETFTLSSLICYSLINNTTGIQNKKMST